MELAPSLTQAMRLCATNCTQYRHVPPGCDLEAEQTGLAKARNAQLQLVTFCLRLLYSGPEYIGIRGAKGAPRPTL